MEKLVKKDRHVQFVRNLIHGRQDCRFFLHFFFGVGVAILLFACYIKEIARKPSRLF